MWLFHWAGASHAHPGVDLMEALRHSVGPELHKLWDDDHPQYSTEMLVLAHRSGAMLDPDLKRFFGRLDAAMLEEAPLPTLRSESPTELDLTRERLERLRSDASMRKRYSDVLHRLWSEVQPEWDATGC